MRIQMVQGYPGLKPIDPTLGNSPVRFYVLTMFCLLQFMQSIQFAFYTAIPDIIRAAYTTSDVTDNDINMSVSVGSLSIILIIPAMTFVDNYFNNARLLTLVSCVLTILALIFRILPHWIDGCTYAQVFMYLASIFVNFASIFTNALPALVASIWFPENERVVATSFATEALSFGDALTYLVLPYICDSSTTAETDVRNSIFWTLIMTAAVSVIIIIYFPARPKYYPSVAIREKERMDELHFLIVYDAMQAGEDTTEAARQDDIARTKALAAGEVYAPKPRGAQGNNASDENTPLMAQPVNTADGDSDEPVNGKWKYSSAREMLPHRIRARIAIQPFIELLKFFIEPQMLLVGLLAALWYGACGCWSVEIAILFNTYGSYTQFGSTITCIHLILNTIGATVASAIAQKFHRREKLIMCIITCLNFLFVTFFIFTFGFGDAKGDICVDKDNTDSYCYKSDVDGEDSDHYCESKFGKDDCPDGWQDYEYFKVYLHLNKYLLAVLVCIHGCFNGALLPLWYDVASQMGYPISGGTTGGYIFFTTAIGIFLVALLYSVLGDGYINIVTDGFLVLTILCLIPFKIRYTRMEVEERARDQHRREQEQAAGKEQPSDSA